MLICMRTTLNLNDELMRRGLPVFCLGEFVRVVTHRRIFDPPTRLESALEALSGSLASPSLRVLN
jgi:hypothetical protein